MKSFSLTRRVLATVVVCQLLLTAGITIAVVVYGRTQLRSAFDSKLASRAMSVLALVRYTETHPPHLTFERELLPPSMDPMHGDLFTVVTADGHVLARSDSAFPAANRKATGRYAEFMMGAVPYRAVWLRGVEVLDQEEDTPSPPDRVDVAYAASLIEMNDELTKLGLSVAGTSLLLLLVASALASWGVRRWLAPLRGLAEQAGAISVHDWTFRPPAEARMARELLPLTEAIETVLTRLRAAFQQQRDFTSDAAHELKTSVAILKSTVQSLQHKQRTAEDYRAGLDRLLEDCERLEELLRRMLCLARIEQWAETSAPERLAVTELNSTCELAVARIQTLAREHNVRVELVNHGLQAIHLRADPEDLEMVWVNLLENAVRYSPPGGKVVMRVEKNGGESASVSVEDFGPGIPQEDLPYIFDRFRRADPSRARSTGGFGLGLAICKAFVTAYGGRIEARRRSVQGTEMRVYLPAESS